MTKPDAPTGMKEVSKDAFYAFIGPRDIHPSVLHSTSYCAWEMRDRTIIGRSYPGWKNPGDTSAYFLRADLA